MKRTMSFISLAAIMIAVPSLASACTAIGGSSNLQDCTTFIESLQQMLVTQDPAVQQNGFTLDSAGNTTNHKKYITWSHSNGSVPDWLLGDDISSNTDHNFYLYDDASGAGLRLFVDNQGHLIVGGSQSSYGDTISALGSISSYNVSQTAKIIIAEDTAGNFGYIQAGDTGLSVAKPVYINPNGGGVNIGSGSANNNLISHTGTFAYGGLFVDPTLAGVANGLAVGAAATPHVTTAGGFTTDYGREFFVVRQQPNIPGPQPNGANWVFANGGVGMITNDANYTPASVVGIGGFYDTLSVVQHDTGLTSGDSTHPYPAGTNYASNGIGVYQDIGNNTEAGNTHLSGANAVAISEYSICHFSGRCWGENPSMSSDQDGTGTGVLWGVEVDINNHSDHETGYGITVAGASSSAGTGFPGFAVNFMDQGAAALPSGYNPYQWSYGMLINQGTSAVGLRIGSTDYRSANGGAITPNAYSQSIELGWNDATNGRTMSIAALNNGAFAITNTSGVHASLELNGLQGVDCAAGSFHPATAVIFGGLIVNCG